jgi:hypothetical protein
VWELGHSAIPEVHLRRIPSQATIARSEKQGEYMQTSHQLVVTAAFVAATAIFLAGCSAMKVSGKTYLTADGDKIEFRDKGKALETNGIPRIIYHNQYETCGNVHIIHTNSEDSPTMFQCRDSTSGRAEAAFFDCSYSLDGDKLNLNCPGAEGTPFTVNKDGSLTGPPAGMWGHAAFAHLVLKK